MIDTLTSPWRVLAAALLVALLPGPAPAQNLQMRLYSSLLPGLSESVARGGTRPAIDYLGERVNWKIEHDIQSGRTFKDLLDFGAKLNDPKRDCHIGAMWGIEYGWLAQQYPKLKVLAVAAQGDNIVQSRTQVLVRKGSGVKKLADLKGKKLALYARVPLMDRLSVQEMLKEEKQEPKGFFKTGEPYATMGEAVDAVRDGVEDCVFVNSSTYGRLLAVQPGLEQLFTVLKSGDAYPDAVLVGNPDKINKVRKDLWRTLEAELLEIHKSPYGKECLEQWRFPYFVKVDPKYYERVDKAVRRFPSERLSTLE
jgi:ABC-type phosphate/phosphonate transport system substrate-binding protein